MTDNNIIKALECCSEPAGKCCCEVCPLHHREDSCTTALIKKTVELVNRQKEEIERLEDKLEEKSTEIKTLIPTIDRLMKINKAEVIEHLKKINFNAFPKEVLNAIKSEAYKELAEGLKTKVNLDLCEAINCSDYLYDLPKLIDNLVKEKIDADNGN